MDIDPKDLWNRFKEATGGSLRRNKDNNVVRVLSNALKSLEGILGGLETFLKNHREGLSKAYSSAKSKGKSILESAKALFEKKNTSSLFNKGTDALSKIKDKFKSFTNKETGPPFNISGIKQLSLTGLLGNLFNKNKEEEETSSPGLVSSIFNRATTKLKDKKEEKTIPIKEKASSWINKAKENMERRKKEVEEEKNRVKNSNKDKNKGSKLSSWLGAILTGLTTLGGIVSKGVSLLGGTLLKGIMGPIKYLGKFLIGGIGKTLFKVVPFLSSNIAKGLSALIGGGAKLAGKAAIGGAKILGRAALPIARLAGGALLRGVGMLATGPIGWAIAAGTAIYGGYKLYKYLTRNNIKDDIYGKLTLLRIYSYGFNDINKEYYSKIFDLEMLMKDYLIFTNGEVKIKKLDKDIIDKVLDIFSVKRDEKEKYSILNNWVTKRFIPAFRSHISSIWRVNSSIYLDNLDNIHREDLKRVISILNIPSSIYNVTQIPVFTNPNTVVTKQDVDTLLTNIANELKINRLNEKTTIEKAAEENNKFKAAQKLEENNVKIANSKANESLRPKVDRNSNSYNQYNPKKEVFPDQEGEKKYSSSAANSNINKVSAKVKGKLNIAPGDLIPGGMDLTGISTKLDKSKIYNLDPNIRELFTGMAKEYNALTGKNINVNEAFRTYEDQVLLNKKYPELAARPGNSVHEFGLALDINSEDTKELDRLGLLRKYGFSTSIGKEEWHIEPIGISMNPTLAKTNNDFRFKAIQASIGKGGGGYGLLPNSITKKRDIPYQTSIYNSNSETPIDIEKVKSNTILESNKELPNMPPKEETNIEGNKQYSPIINNQPSPYIKASNNYNQSYPSRIINNDSYSNVANNYNSSSVLNGREEMPTLNSFTNSVSGMNSNTDLSKYSNLEPIDAIKQAAKMVGLNENILINFAKLESSLNPAAKAPTSSASGLFQITNGTWKDLVLKHGDKYGIDLSSDKNNPLYNSLMAAELAKDNLQRLSGYREAGIDDDTALYMAHFLGVGGANKLFNMLNRNPDANIRSVVSPSVYRANYSIMKDKSVSDLVQAMDTKLNMASNTSAGRYDQSKNSLNGYGSSVRNRSESTSIYNSPETYPSDRSSGFIKTVYNPNISNSRVDMSNQTQGYSTPNREPPTINSNYKEMFNTSKMEGILSEQLSTLTQISTILVSMNDKLDLSKISNTLSTIMNNSGNKDNLRPGIPSFESQIPDSTINLSRKKISV